MKALYQIKLIFALLSLLASGEKEIEAGTAYELEDVLREADLYLEAAKL